MQPQVKPRAVLEATVQKPRSDFTGGGLGWGVAIMVFTVIFGSLTILSNSRRDPFLLMDENTAGDVVVLLTIFVPIILGILASQYSKSRQAKKWREDELLKLTEEAIQEAEKISEHLRDLQAKAVELAAELPRFIRRAEEELSLAEREFEERAYSPFWDHIARAAEHVANYQLTITQIAEIGKSYCGLLDNRDHSFPEKICLRADVTSPAEALARLRKTARQGQKDFEFAQIWEHHKTRRVLVKGFSTLESALYGLGDSLRISLEECASEISWYLAELVDDAKSRS